MFVEDLCEDFYNLIKGKHIILFVNYDIDAICTCKIFQSLFRADCTLYTLVPVEGLQDLIKSYGKYSEQAKYVLLINCGGTIDIVEKLQPNEDVIFFIVDSHKPTDVCNIFSRSQVRLLGKAEETENIPNFEDIFIDSETEEESENETVSEETLLKNKKRNEWEEKRNRIMFEYTQFSFYGRASSLVIFEMLWHLDREDIDCLWWAIIGLTFQSIMELVVEQKYTCELPVLQLHLSRLSTPRNNSDRRNANDYSVSSRKDLKLVLYRHWSVQASIRHTLSTATKLKLWTVSGEKRLYRLLAEIGLPLIESRQNFSSMEPVLRNDFIGMMEAITSNYNLDSLIYHSFLMTVGFKQPYQAADYVFAMIALLDINLEDQAHGDGFLEALDSLARNKTKLIDDGIEKAKKMLICITRQVQSLLDMNQIISAGPFLYFALSEGSVDSKMFSYPCSLAILARYALGAYTSLSKNKRASMLPLIASVTTSEDSCLILGIPPSSELVPRNFFGKAFEQAAELIGKEPLINYFDSSAIKIIKKDRPKFFDALATLLT
uniref:Putative cdc45 cell division cycle 45-like protein n=1 Tax=Triatoma infestans TaxID=30076 RepID=A0A023F0J3_TRIIF